MNNIISNLLHNDSAFRHMTIAALIMGLGTIVATVVDLGWLMGDMMSHAQPHHIYVLVGLVGANLLMLGSFIWLVKGLLCYIQRHNKLVNSKRKHKAKVSKQSTVIMHLNHRIDELENRLNNVQ